MAINTDKRFGVLVLPYEKRDISLPKEIMVDYDSGHIYVKNKDGSKILGISKDLQLKLDNFILNAQDEINVTVEGIQATVLREALNELKSYTDAMVQGLSTKGPARVISLTNINIEGIPTNPIDGVVINEDDVVLLNGQDLKTQNGKWIVKRTRWERTEDFNENTDLNKSAFIFIEEGIKYGDTGWVLANDGVIDIGTTELEFEIFSRAEEIKAGIGLTKNGNVISLESITTAGTGIKVSYDEYGRVISAENPTSIGDLGITDIAPISHIGKGNLEHSIATANEHGFLSSSDYSEFKTNTQSIKDIERELLGEINTKSEAEIISDGDIIQIELNQQFSITDNLNSTATDSALSANQGKILNDKLNDLFTNKNPDNPINLNIWSGTIDQYEALVNKDPNTIYYIEETHTQMRYLSSGGTDPSVIEELLRMINDLELTKANKSGDTFTGNVNIGTSQIPANIEIFGDIYHKGKLLSEIFSIKNHSHVISSITGLEEALRLKANSNHNHNLSELIQDPNHRTVNDEQIAKWDNGSSALDAIEAHNVSKDTHQDIRTEITDLNNKIYSDPVCLNHIIEETVISSEGVSLIQIQYMDFSINKHLVMVFSNSVFVSPSRYSINIDKQIVFNQDELPIDIGTNITIVIINVSGLSIGEINVADITKQHLSVALQTEINNKSEKNHTHQIANVTGLSEYITSTNTSIDTINTALSKKVNESPGMGLSSNDFSDTHLTQLNKNTEALSNINLNIDGKVNGSGNIYTDANIESLNLTFPVSIELLCTTLPINSIVTCDSWILNVNERPELYGHIFIQKSNENRVFLTFYKSLDNNKGFESWSCSYSSSHTPKVSPWELNVTDQLFNISGFGNTVNNVQSVTSADNLPPGTYISNSLTNSPENGSLIQYVTYNWSQSSAIQFAYTPTNIYNRNKTLVENEVVWGQWYTVSKEIKTNITSVLNQWSFSNIRNENNISFIKNGKIISVEGILIPGSLTPNVNICAMPFGCVPDNNKDVKLFDINTNNFIIVTLSVDGFIKFKSSSNTCTNVLFNFTYQI